MSAAPRREPAQHPGLSKQDYATPPEFILAVKLYFAVTRFSFDLAARPENSKGTFHFCEEENSLVQTWPRAVKRKPIDLWLNPPFANIDAWASKCREWWATAALGSRLFLLTPASIGSKWFHEHVNTYASVYALRGRLCFDRTGPYPKDCMLSVYRAKAPPKMSLIVWDWRRDAESARDDV